MLNSIILSLVMSISPASSIDSVTNATDLQTQEVNQKRGTIRMNQKRGTIRMNQKRGTIRMNQKRGTIRM